MGDCGTAVMKPDDPLAQNIIRHAMVARIATVSRSGRPHVNPLYFVYGAPTIYLGTMDRTLAARNIAANPRVALLFTTDGQPGSILRVRGRAMVRTDPGLIRWYLRRDARKYFMTPRGLADTVRHARLLPLLRRYLSSGAKGERCVIEVQPVSAELLTATGPGWSGGG